MKAVEQHGRRNVLIGDVGCTLRKESKEAIGTPYTEYARHMRATKKQQQWLLVLNIPCACATQARSLSPHRVFEMGPTRLKNIFKENINMFQSGDHLACCPVLPLPLSTLCGDDAQCVHTCKAVPGHIVFSSVYKRRSSCPSRVGIA